MKILDLVLKKEWFDMIKNGNKREEYREIKPYWTKRLIDKDGNFKKVLHTLNSEMVIPIILSFSE